MQDSDTVCISRNQAIIGGIIVFIVLFALFANFINTRRLSERSRASGTDLEALPAAGFADRVKEVTAACQELQGHLAWTGKDDSGAVIFDRFTGHYYSLDRVNPVVTPQPGQPLSGYCAVSGKPGGNWCKSITAETACKADCAWVAKGSCYACAPMGVDPDLICP